MLHGTYENRYTPRRLTCDFCGAEAAGITTGGSERAEASKLGWAMEVDSARPDKCPLCIGGVAKSEGQYTERDLKAMVAAAVAFHEVKYQELQSKLDAESKAAKMLAESSAGAMKRLAAVREWLKESPVSERISARRCHELLGIVGRPDEEGEIVFDHLDAERWA